MSFTFSFVVVTWSECHRPWLVPGEVLHSSLVSSKQRRWTRNQMFRSNLLKGFEHLEIHCELDIILNAGQFRQKRCGDMLAAYLYYSADGLVPFITGCLALFLAVQS